MESALRSALAEGLGSPVAAVEPVHGGDVAQSYRVDLVDGRRVFAKTHRRAPPGFFTTEAAGLSWLRAPGVVPVPEVILVPTAMSPTAMSPTAMLAEACPIIWCSNG